MHAVRLRAARHWDVPLDEVWLDSRAKPEEDDAQSDLDSFKGDEVSRSRASTQAASRAADHGAWEKPAAPADSRTGRAGAGASSSGAASAWAPRPPWRRSRAGAAERDPPARPPARVDARRAPRRARIERSRPRTRSNGAEI